MGSKWGVNKGIPATPRDGAPIELVAMQHSILTWLAGLSKRGVIKTSSAKISGKEVSFADWAAKIKINFEKCFWVPQTKEEDSKYKIEN